MPTIYSVPSSSDFVPDSEPEREMHAVQSESPRSSPSPAQSAFPVSSSPLLRMIYPSLPPSIPRTKILLETKRLNLAEFAFRRSPAGSSVLRQASTLKTTNSVDAPSSQKNKPKNKVTSSLSALFADSELVGLKKCIACDAVWTVRKTASQKLIHIQSCTKKKGYSRDTIYLLLRNEINAAAAKGPDTTQRKLSKAILSSGTHFDDIIHDTSKAKSKKNITKPATVLEPSTANVDIRQKATMTYGTAASNLDLSSSPPRTQAFGTSLLAQRQGGALLQLVGPDSETDDSESPDMPSAQLFGSSRLATSSIAPKQSLLARLEDYDDPESNFPKGSELTRSPLSHDALASSVRKHADILDDGSRDPFLGEGLGIRKPASPRDTSETTYFTEEDIWEESLKARIYSDNKLRLKILRFEPIHFDTFLALIPESKPSGKTRTALRSFLDKNAIQFYAPEASGRN